MTIPSAHLGHWAWIFYVIPILIVITSILRSTYREKKRERKEREGKVKEDEI